MRSLLFLSFFMLLFGCKSDKEQTPSVTEETSVFKNVEVTPILENDSLSIRAIQVIGPNLAFAANNGVYGLYNSKANRWKTGKQLHKEGVPEYRSVASTSSDFFMLSVAKPALLYKTGDKGEMELVYKEENEGVFYDSMAFWNNKEGLAMGDPTDGCLSVIITRDGGLTWTKLDCGSLPAVAEGEAAFAASNSNIAIQGDEAWLLSGGKRSRVYHTSDKGNSWEVFDTPLMQGKETTGGYSIDFYDNKNGFIIGGDYTKPELNKGNKARTTDGGRTWELVAEGKAPGYKSSVRYVPNSEAKSLVATGFSGISYSHDGGETWQQLSSEGFYTLRFVNDSTAYAAGKGKIAKLVFH